MKLRKVTERERRTGRNAKRDAKRKVNRET